MTNEFRRVKVAEFAELTGLSRKRVISLCLRGEVKASKLSPSKRNSPWMIPVSEAQRLLEEAA